MTEHLELLRASHINAITDGYADTVTHFRDRLGFQLLLEQSARLAAEHDDPLVRASLVTEVGVSGHGDVSQSGAVSASISIDAASLDTGNRRRDRHLRSADFFDADSHPSVVIATTRVDPPSENEAWSVAADLTAAGHTEPVELELTLEDANEHSVRVRGKLVTDRTRFGMTWSPMRMASSIAELDVDLRFVRNDH